MGSVPFSLYDFLGYLSAGALYLLAASYISGGVWISEKSPALALQILWLLLAYLIGHVNAHWASWLLQTQTIKSLGTPSTHLFRHTGSKRFKHYRSPLPEETAVAIIKKYEKMTGSREPGEAMFLYCYHLVKEKCPQAYSRLNAFLGLYGFSRNMSFATLVLAASFAWIAARGEPSRWLLAGAALIIAFTLFLRFLKFYRLFSIEVFTSFLTGVPDEPYAAPATAAADDPSPEAQAKRPQ